MGGYLSRFWKIIKSFKAWQWLLILIPLLFLTATFLRLDHLHMSSLKQAVIAADEEGNTEKTTTALNDLKKYTESHTIITILEKNGNEQITFGSGPVYLEKSYIRDATAAIERAEQQLAELGDENPNGNVFAKAMDVCKPQAIAGGWAWNSPAYLNCMTGEINKYPTTERIEDTIKADIPSTALYRYDFASPILAPTPAGIFTIICCAITVVIFIKFLCWLISRLSLLITKKI